MRCSTRRMTEFVENSVEEENLKWTGMKHDAFRYSQQWRMSTPQGYFRTAEQVKGKKGKKRKAWEIMKAEKKWFKHEISIWGHHFEANKKIALPALARLARVNSHPLLLSVSADLFSLHEIENVKIPLQLSFIIQHSRRKLEMRRSSRGGKRKDWEDLWINKKQIWIS